MDAQVRRSLPQGLARSLGRVPHNARICGCYARALFCLKARRGCRRSSTRLEWAQSACGGRWGPWSNSCRLSNIRLVSPGRRRFRKPPERGADSAGGDTGTAERPVRRGEHLQRRQEIPPIWRLLSVIDRTAESPQIARKCLMPGSGGSAFDGPKNQSAPCKRCRSGALPP